MTGIEPHLNPAELEARYKTANDPIAKSHFHALWLLSLDYDRGEVAEILGFSTRWVIELVRRYNEGGPARLGDQRVNNGTKPCRIAFILIDAQEPPAWKQGWTPSK